MTDIVEAEEDDGRRDPARPVERAGVSTGEWVIRGGAVAGVAAFALALLQILH